MKHFILMGVMSLFLFYSCTTTVNRASQRDLRGSWNLDKVTYSERDVKVKAFDSYDAQCLRNSTWFFVANNNTGNFTINQGESCPQLTQKFTWYIDSQNMFILKPINEGDKARKVTVGTTYQFVSISDSEFVLNQVVSGLKISYHFIKISSK